ncbi:MAG: cob(I)yrinic acid a,c-diamide adenosyltransferase [Paludibacteraceae bacterium]|nr:cob(I)yrinic acid a,c-diamide adenosyltransferase [Paludibacteraceae bacterium]
MPIYTKTGDRGETSLANMQRVSKSSPRLEAYGTADELNAWVGMLRAQCQKQDVLVHAELGFSCIDDMLQRVQNRLFNVGAALSMAEGEWLKEEDVLLLENWIDSMQSMLPPMRCFILPIGSEAIATAHLCRTVTRRLERLVVALQKEEGTATEEEIILNEIILRYINRLSDYFFTLSRYIAYLSDIQDVPWRKE